jgi:hypothetical protein
MTEPTFWQWLKEQKRRDDLVGDLARDAAHDPACKRNTLSWWEDHLNRLGACPGAKDALLDAWAGYLRFVRNRPLG